MVKWLGISIVFALVWIRLGSAIDGMVSLADGGFVLPDAYGQYLVYTSRSKVYISIVSSILFLVFTKNRKSSYARFAEDIIPRIMENQNANMVQSPALPLQQGTDEGC